VADIARQSLNPPPHEQAFSAQGVDCAPVEVVALRRFSPLAAALVACSRASAPPPRPPAGAAVDAGRDSYIARPRRPSTGCPAATGAPNGDGSLHGDTVAGAERWLAAESPHRVPYGVHVHPGASLTIEPCALLLVGPGMEVVVHGGGTLRASAEAGRPIRFARLDPAHAWQAVEVRAEASAGTSLAGATVEGAGAPPSERGVTAASLRVAMRGGLLADGLSIVGGDGWGVAVVGDGRFADRDATIELRGLRGDGAVTVEDVNRVADLPRLRLRDNASNDVRVEARVRTVNADARWRALGDGARYVLRPAMHLLVEGAASPALTLEPGAALAFGADAELDVGFGGRGALVAVGDSLHPVVFAASSGDRWVGIHLGPRVDVARTAIRFARIERAGAPSGVQLPACGCEGARIDEAMLTIQGVGAPPPIGELAFVDGPAEGFAMVTAGDFPDYRPGVGALDFTRSGVRCAAATPMRAGRCAAAPGMRAESR
jgi:hypothetical protein